MRLVSEIEKNDIVWLRNGNQYDFCNLNSDSYNDDLTSRVNNSLDIVEVYRVNKSLACGRIILWTR